MKKLVVIGLLFCSLLFRAQNINQVFNAAGGGGQVGSSNMEAYYNIGEPIVSTENNINNFVTQGFLQPDIAGEFGLAATSFISPNSCADKTDGFIRITASISGGVPQSDFQISYYWSPSSYCTDSSKCSTITDLPAGTYSVMVVSHYIGSAASVPNDTVSFTNMVVSGSTEPCQITVFNGVSPNGDGNNDVFFIENIDQFPSNNVEVFNRWGQKLFEAKNYDNVNTVWKGTMKESGTPAPSGTYFYIITLGNGTKPIKGWLELTSNQ
jgi:gliding motility-associated-like protein